MMESYGQEIPLQCNYCNKSFSGVVPASQHFQSATHKKKEETARRAAESGGASHLMCDVCNIWCDTSIILEHHKVSPKHLAMVEKNQQMSQSQGSQPYFGSGFVGTEPVTQSQDLFGRNLSSEETAQKEYVFNGTRGFCNLCNIELTSAQHASQHLNGSKHKKKLNLQSALNMRQTAINPNAASPYGMHLSQDSVPVYHPQVNMTNVTGRTFDDQVTNVASDMEIPRQVYTGKLPDSKLYCETCCVQAEDYDAMIDHLKSTKHETNVLNKNIKLSRSSSIASGADANSTPDVNPVDYVSYTDINEQMSALGLSDKQELKFDLGIQETMKKEVFHEPELYGHFLETPETESQFRKYFDVGSVNLTPDSMLSEESLKSNRSTEAPETGDIIAKPFPVSDGHMSGGENNRLGNRVSPTTDYMLFNQDRNIPVSRSNSVQSPTELIRNKWQSAQENIGNPSLPLLNNAGLLVGVGRGMSTQPNTQYMVKQTNLTRQNTAQQGTVPFQFENLIPKDLQSPAKDSDDDNLKMRNLEFEGSIHAKPFNSEHNSLSHHENSIIAKPFEQGSSIIAKPFSSAPSGFSQQADSINAKPFSSGPNSFESEGSKDSTGENIQAQLGEKFNHSTAQEAAGRNMNVSAEARANFAFRPANNAAARVTSGMIPQSDCSFDEVFQRGYCHICDVSLTSKQHMVQHISGRKHKNAKELKQRLPVQSVYNRELFCDVCLVPFTGPEAQETHLKSDKHKKKLEQKAGINKSAGFFCEVCLVECSGEDNYKQHLIGEQHKRKLGQKNVMPGVYFCDTCKVECSGEDNYKQHLIGEKHKKMEVSGGNVRQNFYFCDTCKIECSGEDNYKQHLIGEKHKKKSLEQSGGIVRLGFYYCDACKIECSGEDNYKQHLIGEKHRKKTGGCIPQQVCWQCDVCGCSVNSQQQLLIHQTSEHPEKYGTMAGAGILQGAGVNVNPSLVPNMVTGTEMPVCNPLQEFLSVELFPKDQGFGSPNSSAHSSGEFQQTVDNTTVKTPEITTTQPVQMEPRYVALNEVNLNTSNIEDNHVENSGSGTKRGRGSDLAFALRNRNSGIGNQNSSATDKTTGTPITEGLGVGTQASPFETRTLTNNEGTGVRPTNNIPHFLDKLPGDNPFANTHPFYCHTCRSPANTRESYESHLQGKRHLAKVGTEPAPQRPHCEAKELGIEFKPHTKSKPRDYQWELYHNALKSDSICFLPTGTGKTLVSVMLMSAMLEKFPTRPVLFVVDKVLLVLQQSRYITTELGDFEFTRYNPDSQSLAEIVRRRLRIATLCMDQQSTHGVPLWKHDIIVVTAAFCQNLMGKGILRWEDFSLVVFDEAHHCDKRHPFNGLLYTYHLKLYNTKRPKILGLTASPAGKDTIPATVTMLEKLIANMGGVSMNIVQKCKQTLAEFQSNAQIIIRPQPDQFNDIVTMFVSELQVYLVHCFLRLVPLSDIQVYVDFNKYVTQSANDEKIQQIAKSCVEENLEALQIALTNVQCRNIEDKLVVREFAKHMESICMALNSLMEGGIPCALEEINGLEKEEYNFDFAKNFQLPCEKLQSIYYHTKESMENPTEANRIGTQEFGSHISRLIEELTNSLDIDWSQRETVKPMALVLVKERATVHRITSILQNNHLMQRMNLRVTKVVGHGKTGASEAAGMNVNQQKRVLAEIKEYKYQVIVATSVAEEGVDWPECELVISLYPPSTLTALVQMRGRARKKNSKFVVLCSHEGERQAVEDLKNRENNMMIASEMLYERILQSQ